MRVRDMTFVAILRELLHIENDQSKRYLQRGQILETATKRQKVLLRELVRRDYALSEKQFDRILGL